MNEIKVRVRQFGKLLDRFFAFVLSGSQIPEIVIAFTNRDELPNFVVPRRAVLGLGAPRRRDAFTKRPP